MSSQSSHPPQEVFLAQFILYPSDTRRWINVGLRRWTNVKPTLIQRLLSAGISAIVDWNPIHFLFQVTSVWTSRRASRVCTRCSWGSITVWRGSSTPSTHTGQERPCTRSPGRWSTPSSSMSPSTSSWASSWGPAWWSSEISHFYLRDSIQVKLPSKHKTFL